MPRMRTLKPEACTSESLATIDRGVRWTFATFWTHCDDDGRAVWNLRLIKAALYPLDDDVDPDVLADDFAELERVGAVCRYEVDGKEYVHVPAFAEHQHPNRPVASKLPPCPKTDHTPTPHAQVSEDARSGHEALTPVVVGEGRGEAGEGHDLTAEPPAFCSRHPNGTRRACGACEIARKRWKRWDELAAASGDAKRRAELEARRNCPYCDENGFLTDEDGKPIARCHNHRRSA